MSAAVAPAVEPLQLAQRIQGFTEGSDDPFALLSLAPGLPSVTLTTPVGDLRSNYRKLAAMIHPDRLKKVFEHATEAFQKLVRVFENVNDPSYRAKLTAASGGGKKSGIAKAEKKPKESKPMKEANEKKKADKKTKTAKPSKKKKGDEDDDAFIESDSEAEDSSSDEDDDFSEDDAEDLQIGKGKAANVKIKAKPSAPIVDEFGMKAREARDNTGCYKTPVACPNCADPWVPDDARHYVMLMCYGVRVFCNTCLLQFGPATAVHSCPCCKGSANYATSMFDKKVKCPLPKCGKTYGFFSTAVTDKHLADVREKMRAEAATRARNEERAQRAAARRGGADSVASSSSAPNGIDDAALQDAIGQCMVTGSCPVCDKRVGMKSSREHVSQCMANPPKKRRAATVIIGEAGERKKAAAAAAKKKKDAEKKKTTALAPKTKKAAGKKSAGKKRGRAGDDSDSSVYDSDSDSGYASSG